MDLQFGIDEALEMLVDFHSQSSLAIQSPEERLALIRLHGALEKSLVEPFRRDYRKLLEAARARLNAQCGSV